MEIKDIFSIAGTVFAVAIGIYNLVMARRQAAAQKKIDNNPILPSLRLGSALIEDHSGAQTTPYLVIRIFNRSNKAVTIEEPYVYLNDDSHILLDNYYKFPYRLREGEALQVSESLESVFNVCDNPHNLTVEARCAVVGGAIFATEPRTFARGLIATRTAAARMIRPTRRATDEGRLRKST